MTTFPFFTNYLDNLAERYWIGGVVAGEPSNRDREAKFKAQGLTGVVHIQITRKDVGKESPRDI